MFKLIPLPALMLPLLVACGGATPTPQGETTRDGWRIVDDQYELKVTRAPDEGDDRRAEADEAIPSPPEEGTVSARPK